MNKHYNKVVIGEVALSEGCLYLYKDLLDVAKWWSVYAQESVFEKMQATY